MRGRGRVRPVGFYLNWARALGLAPALALALCVAGDRALAAKPKTGTIVVKLQGFENSKGKAVALLFRSEDGFAKKESKAHRRLERIVSGGKAQLEFSGVPLGVYAVWTYHDANNNGRMDTNFIGIPTEKVAVSNNATGFMGPPSWNDAKFRHAKRRSGIRLKMISP